MEAGAGRLHSLLGVRSILGVCLGLVVDEFRVGPGLVSIESRPIIEDSLVCVAL